MALDLWFRDDVQRILTSQAAVVARLPDDEYRRGRLEQLTDLALAFGVAPPPATWREERERGER